MDELNGGPPGPEPADVFERLGDVEAVPVEGGPVAVAPREAYLLGRLGWFANPDVDLEVLVDGEVGAWVERSIDPGVATIRTAPDGRVRLGFSPARTVHDVEAQLRWHADAFADLPDGVRLDVITAAEGTPAGRMGFSGTVRAGRLDVWGSWPGVDADTLVAALDLAREAEGGTVQARSEQEIAAVRARWRAEGLQRVAPLEVHGAAIGHDQDRRFTLRVAAALFAVRFSDTWECVQPEDPLAELGLDLEDELSSLETDEWPTRGTLHADPESGRRYLLVSTDQLPTPVERATEPVLEAFEAAGAVRVGDTVCDASPAILIRAAADTAGRWYGVLMVAAHAEPVIEVYSSFDDGSSLTTTTNPFGGLGGADRGIHRNPMPKQAPVADLVAAHLRAVEAHAAERTTRVRPLRQDLAGMARALEEFLSRQVS